MSKHTCLCYGSKENLFDFVVPFFKHGLRVNELCVWVVPESIGIEGAKAALSAVIKDLDACIENGRMQLLNHKDVYLKSGKFDKDEVLRVWGKKEADALKQGFTGLCVSGDGSWVREKDWDKVVAYEHTVDKLLPKTKITALCTYHVEKFDKSQVYELSRHHGVTIRKKSGKTDILFDRNAPQLMK